MIKKPKITDLTPPYTSSSSAQTYTCNLRIEPPEFELDLDDLECIVQQLEAISRGWGMDFDKDFIKEEGEEALYTWTSNGPSNLG